MSKRYYDEGSYKEDYCENSSTECCSCSSARTCDTRQLIQNGGFEDFTPAGTLGFANWNAATVGPAVVTALNIAYEGARALVYNPSPLIVGGQINNSLTLTQNVNVTPGCRYTLRFAENFLDRGINATAPRLTARVYYVQGGTQIDLISTTIVKGNGDADVNRGYTFHEKTASVPVPCNVSGVVVEFRFDAGINAGMTWLLDGVSLQAVSGTSACR